MIDLLFFIGCGFAGMVPALVALTMRKAKLALLLALIWFVLSAILLWSVGLGPHGFILFAFVPFWTGNVAALIWALIRINKESAVA